MKMSTPLACLYWGPNQLWGKREAIAEAYSVLDVQAEDISNPNEESTKNHNEEWYVWMAQIPRYPYPVKYPLAKPLSA